MPTGADSGQVEAWGRARKLDLLISQKGGCLSVTGLDLGIGFVLDPFWSNEPPQNVVDYFSLERNQPKGRIALWPPTDYWREEQGWPDGNPSRPSSQAATYYFRTRDGALGMLHVAGMPTDSNAIRLSYKLAEKSGSARVPGLVLRRRFTAAGPSIGSSYRRPDPASGHVE